MALLAGARFALGALALAAVIGAPHGAHAQAVTQEAYPERKIPFPGRVISYPDVTYSSVPGYRPLKLDLYVPATRGPHPLVIYVHGGGWVGGQPRLAGTIVDFPSTLAAIAARGYTVASVSYRLSGEARFPAAIQDVKTSIRWLRANAAKYAIDPERALIWGSSAGGQLAALAGTSCGVADVAPQLPANSPLASQSDCVQGVILWYPVTDFETITAQTAALGIAPPPGGGAAGGPNQYLGCAPAACLPVARWASPIDYVDAKDPPFLIFHGDIDKTVPVAQSQTFSEALTKAGVKTELVVVPGMDHSFITADGKPSPETNKMALDKMAVFIDQTIGAKR